MTEDRVRRPLVAGKEAEHPGMVSLTDDLTEEAQRNSFLPRSRLPA